MSAPVYAATVERATCSAGFQKVKSAAEEIAHHRAVDATLRSRRGDPR